MDFSSPTEPAVKQPQQDPEKPITRPDVSFVADDGNWDTWLWSQMPWSAPRGPDDLVGMEEQIDQMVGSDGLIGDFNLIGHGVPGAMSLGDPNEGFVGDPDAMHSDQLAALQAVAGHMAEDSEIVLGGCNVGMDPATLAEIAKSVDQTTVAGKSIQLPFPGIEGTEIRAIPSDIPGGEPTIVEESNFGDQLYDDVAQGTADTIASATSWTKSTFNSAVNAATGFGQSAVDTATGFGQSAVDLGTSLGQQAGIVAPDIGPVLPPIELPPQETE